MLNIWRLFWRGFGFWATCRIWEPREMRSRGSSAPSVGTSSSVSLGAMRVRLLAIVSSACAFSNLHTFRTASCPRSPPPRLAEIGDAIEIVENAWDAALALPYTGAAVDAISKALVETPVGDYMDNPLYQPLASGVALYAAAAAALAVLKAALELLLLPVCSSTTSLNLVSPERYVLGRRIGSGSYGAVYDGFQASSASADPSVVSKIIDALNTRDQK